MLPGLIEGLFGTLVKWLALIYSYCFIGASLKYIDQVYDEGVFNKTISWILAVITGLMIGLLIAFDSSSAVILLAIIIGVGIASKLDNIAHRTVALLSFGVPAFLAINPPPGFFLQIDWIPLALLVGAGVLDEYTDELGDQKNKWILTIRPFMKAMVILLVIAGAFDIIYLAAFLCFDLAYILVGWYSHILAVQATTLGKLSRKRHILAYDIIPKNYRKYLNM